MKKITTPLLWVTGALGLLATSAQAQNVPLRRTCSSHEVLQRQLDADPGFAERLQAIDHQSTAF